MENLFSPTEIVGGLAGLGLVFKGIIDHLAQKRKVAAPLLACKYDPAIIGKFLLEMERLNMKLDHLKGVFNDSKR